MKKTDKKDIDKNLVQSLEGGLCVVGALKYADNCLLYRSDDGKNYALVLEYEQYCVYMTGNDCDFALEVTKTLDKPFTMGAVHTDIADFLKNRYKVNWWRNCLEYVYNGQPIQHNIVNDVRPLSSEFWQRVSEGTPYKPSQEEVVTAIETRLSSAVYIENQPVCWCILHDDNSMGMLYTMPEYRHKGLALDVMTDIVRKIHAQGEVPFGHIISDNVASINLAKKYNLDYYRDCIWANFEKE